MQILGALPVNSSIYVRGEESPAQIRIRADRIGVERERINCLPATDFASIINAVSRHKPEYLIVDSIQTTYVDEIAAAPGRVTLVREVAAGLLRLAKE